MYVHSFPSKSLGILHWEEGLNPHCHTGTSSKFPGDLQQDPLKLPPLLKEWQGLQGLPPVLPPLCSLPGFDLPTAVCAV